ncbi:MAG TPA: M56 family metallopeptidase [Candidatus Angelobacter sp.]|nr:M56 family metallopeptidase [Candidatus Angelobacter sp.]
MNPELSLHFAAIFLTFFLRVTVGCLFCWMLSRLLRQPRQRFVVWLGFLLGSAAYWLVLILSEASALIWPAKIAVAGSGAPGSAPGSALAAAHPFVVPAAWSNGILTGIQLLGLGYVVVVMLLAAWAALRYLRLRLLLRRGIEPSEELNELFRETCRDMGVSRASLMILPGLKSPATAGWWKACVLLPEACEELGATPQVADVLCHELIHVQRRDYLWAGLGNLLCCLLFFHPAIWKARAWMSLQGELACDDTVLATRPGDRADYAESLTYFVRLRMLQEGFSVGVDFAASSALALRIRAILAAPQPLPRWKRMSRATAALALLGMLVALAPALAILFHFAPAERPQAFASQPVRVAAAAQGRSVRHSHSREVAQPQSQDTLTTLRVQPYVGETPAYTLTSTTRPSGGGEVDRDGPAWKESSQPVRFPSVSDVVYSTVSRIPVTTRRGGHDHDSDDR